MKEITLSFDGEPRAKVPLDDQNRMLIASRGDYQIEVSSEETGVIMNLIHKDLARCGHCSSPKIRVGDVLLCPNSEDSPMHGFNPGNPACGISFDDMLKKYGLTREDYRNARKKYYQSSASMVNKDE